MLELRNGLGAGLALVLLLLAGCQTVSNGGVDSETHFLRPCDDGCADGLECICGVCSRTCSPAHDCSAESPQASCVSGERFAPREQCEGEAQPSVCDVLCDSDADCVSLGDSHTCRGGSCRADALTSDAPSRPDEGSQQSGPDASTRDSGATVRDGAVVDADARDGATQAVGSPPSPLDHCPDHGIERFVGENTRGCTCTAPGVVSTCYPIAFTGSCVVDGQTYPATYDVPSDDPCERCRCTTNSTVECFPLACPVCEYQGDTVGPGTYPAGDGCNSCTCHEGEMSCTTFDCSTLDERCDLPFDPGPCDAALPVTFHNPRTGQCEAAEWGGCEGNANRFDTLAACEATCGARPARRGCMAERAIVEHGQLVHDPLSCNACICDDGELAHCTQHDCAYACPAGLVDGKVCPGCDADGTSSCDLVGHGCFVPCASDEDCEPGFRCGQSGLCEVGVLCQ